MSPKPFEYGRSGAANSLTLTLVAALGALVVAGWLMANLGSVDSSTTGNSTSDQPLVVYCAAGIRPAVERIAHQYQEEYHVSIQLQYGGSNTLLSQIEAAGMGDLYVAADDSYIQLGREKELIEEAIPLAWQEPVIAVAKGNPKSISSIEDLFKSGVTTALGNPDQAAVGKVTRRLLQASGRWDRLAEHVTKTGVYKPTVPEVANDVKLGAIDAGIIWDATVANYPQLEIVRVPELAKGKAQIAIGVLSACKQPARALHFARYVGANDKGLQIFRSKGFNIVDGDDWADRPEMVFYCGSVNRRAVEPILKKFEQREGVSITTIYNGCGILSGQMKAITGGGIDDTFPDVYMACDVYYLTAVEDLFQDAVNVSETEIVMAVVKGNPKNIRTLQDLTKDGIRVAVGQPDQCTIGVLTKQLLEEAGLYEAVQKNVQTEVATSSMLLATVTTESVDVALAYACDTQFESGRVDIVHIDSPAAKAVQPFSIARSSSQKHLSRRLYDAVARSRESFEDAGFHWRLNSKSAASAQ